MLEKGFDIICRLDQFALFIVAQTNDEVFKDFQPELIEATKRQIDVSGRSES